MKKNFFQKNLFLLLGGQLISQVGDKFYALALALWVLDTTGSPSLMGLMLFFSLAPAVVFGFFSGGLIDRLNRKAILVLNDVFRGLLMVLVLALYQWGGLNLAWIFITEILLSASAAFFYPTVQAVIPQIVEKEGLAKANAKSQLISGISLVAGPALGGLLLSWLGYGWIFLFNAASFFLSAGMEALLKIAPVLQNDTKAKGMKENLKEGYRYIFKKKNLLVIISIVAIIHFFVGSIQVIIPVFSTQIGGDSARNLGYVQTAFGVGVLAAALLLNLFRIHEREGKTLFRGIFSAGLLMAVFGGAGMAGMSAKLPFLLLFFLISGSVIVISTCYQIILQKNVQNEFAGRVFSVVGSVGNFSLPVASLLFGCLIGAFSVYAVGAACGIAIVILSILLYNVYRRRG